MVVAVAHSGLCRFLRVFPFLDVVRANVSTLFDIDRVSSSESIDMGVVIFSGLSIFSSAEVTPLNTKKLS
jgi:hypothetical protein